MVRNLLFLLLGGVAGMVVERVASILHVVYFTLRHRRIRGEYEHANGFVRIKLKCGHRFVTDGQEHDPSNNWKGSFELDDVYMNTGREAYHHTDRVDDWGYHYVRLLENGDLSVQWENMSAGVRKTDSLVWHKKR